MSVSGGSKAEDEGQSHENLLSSETRYKALVEQVPAFIYVETNDRYPRALYVSPGAMEMLGETPADYDAEDGTYLDTIHPDDRDRVHERWETSFATGEPFHDEYRYVRPDGGVVWVIDDSRLARSPEGAPLYWVGVLLDISARRAMELELRTSEARYRALVEEVPVVVYEMGPDDERRTIYVSRYVEEFFGYTRHEWLDQPDIWIELLHPDDREIVLATHDLHNESGEPWLEEYRLIANDGQIVWVHDHAVLGTAEEGLPPMWHGVMLDISARKQLEEQLGQANEELELRVMERTAALADANEMMTLEIHERRRMEVELLQARERYRHLLEDLPVVVYHWHVDDPGGEDSLSYTSPQVERMLGYSSAEWNSPTLWIERLHPHDRERVLAATAHSEATGEPFDEELRYLRRDGGVMWAHSHATLLKRTTDGRPLIFQGVLVDITSRKQAEGKAEDAEERLVATEVLGSVGLYEFDLVREPSRHVEFRYLSPALARMIGTTVEEFIRDPASWARRIHPDDRERVLADVEDQFRTGQSAERTYRIIQPDGRIAWIRAESRCIGHDEQRRPSRFRSAVVDITREKEEQARLRESDSAVRSFFATMPGIPWKQVVEHGPGSGRTVYIGPQVEALRSPVATTTGPWSGTVWHSTSAPRSPPRSGSLPRPPPSSRKVELLRFEGARAEQEIPYVVFAQVDLELSPIHHDHGGVDGRCEAP